MTLDLRSPHLRSPPSRISTELGRALLHCCSGGPELWLFHAAPIQCDTTTTDETEPPSPRPSRGRRLTIFSCSFSWMNPCLDVFQEKSK